jgi:choline dehydrogenase
MMMESEGGGAIPNLLIKDGQRRSVFRSYVYPMLDRPNLTVLTGTTAHWVSRSHAMA